MKKILSLLLSLLLILTNFIPSFADTKGTPDDVFSKLTRLFGDPSLISRSGFANDLGSFLNNDGIFIYKLGTQVGQGSTMFIFNHPKKPDTGYLWFFSFDDDEEGKYKEVFSLLLDCTDGYGIAEDNDCWFFTNTNSEKVHFHTVGETTSNTEFNNINDFIQYIIDNYASVLSDWYASYHISSDVEPNQNTNKTEMDESYHASKEDFSFHSGVKLGMTRDEVISAEKTNKCSCQSEDLKLAYYTSSGEYMWKTVPGLVVNGSIAGIPDSQVYYYFDESDKLFNVLYIFKRGTAQDLNEEIVTQYNTIENQLTQKYSTIWEYCLGDDYPSNVDAIDSRGTINKHSAHKIRINENESLYIYHRLSHAEFEGYDLDEQALLMGTGRHFLDYRLVKDDEIEAIEKSISEKEEKERKKQEDAEKEKQQQLDSDI